MITVLSPAKTLDYENPPQTLTFTLPSRTEESQQLIDVLVEKSSEDLQELMKISEKLAELNLGRYKTFELPFSPGNAKQAILAFKGDVYKDLEVDLYSEEDYDFAQQHMRILSGLYGSLRPLDLMQAYRLEMGTKLVTETGKNLYAFWGEKIAADLKAALVIQKDNIIFNLASKEYFKSVDKSILQARIVDVTFLENKQGVYKLVSFFAKRARGTMTNWLIQNRIDDPVAALAFAEDGYYFSPERSDTDHIVFLRDGKDA
jgi:hypothetical protein